MKYGPKSNKVSNGKQNGFVLIELMSVVVIMSILGTMAVGLMNENGKKAKFTEVEKAISALKTDIEVCYAQTHDLSQCQNGMNGVRAELGAPGRLTTGDNSDYGANANLGKHTAWVSTTARGAAAAGGAGGGMPPEVIEPIYKWMNFSNRAKIANGDISGSITGSGLYDTPEEVCAAIVFPDTQSLIVNPGTVMPLNLPPATYGTAGNMLVTYSLLYSNDMSKTLNFDYLSSLPYSTTSSTNAVNFQTFKVQIISNYFDNVTGSYLPFVPPRNTCISMKNSLMAINNIQGTWQLYTTGGFVTDTIYDTSRLIELNDFNANEAINPDAYSAVDNVSGNRLYNFDLIPFKSISDVPLVYETVGQPIRASYACPTGYSKVSSGQTYRYYGKRISSNSLSWRTLDPINDLNINRIDQFEINGQTQFITPLMNNGTMTYQIANPNFPQNIDLFTCALTDPQAAIDAGIGGAGGGAAAPTPTSITIYASALGTDIDTASDGMNGEDIRLIGTVGPDGSIGWTIDPNSTCVAAGICKP